MVKKIEGVNIPFKCGPNRACVVKSIVDNQDYDLNLKIHTLRNCIRCNGIGEPDYDAIL